MITETMQRHATSGETYILRYTDNEITGVCGPLHPNDPRPDDPEFCPDFDTEDCEWANAEPWQCPDWSST